MLKLNNLVPGGFWWNFYPTVCLLRMSSYLCLWYAQELSCSPVLSFDGKNSPTHAGCFVVVFSSSHRTNVAVTIHHSTSLVSDSLISWKETVVRRNTSPEKKCMYCLTEILYIAKAIGSNQLLTPKGTQMYLVIEQFALRYSGIWLEVNGFVWMERIYTVKCWFSFLPTFPSLF